VSLQRVKSAFAADSVGYRSPFAIASPYSAAHPRTSKSRWGSDEIYGSD